MNEFYEFAAFRLDLKKRRLMRGEEIIPLTPKEYDVLFLLIENAGRVVEKDELMEKIWSDAFVEEGTLTRNISWLRKKLAAHAENDEKIIETLPKRGYRFLPEIIKHGEPDFVLEEQTVQYVQIEEIIEMLPDGGENSIVHGKNFETNLQNFETANSKNADLSPKSLPAAPVKKRFSLWWILSFVLILGIITLIAYRGYFSQNQPKMLLASKIVPFSGLPGRENSPAFSPDGRQMVFTWDGGVEGAQPNIYVKLIGAGEPVRLTKTPHEEINPVYSPDGKSIAFVRVYPAHNEIILIPALGGAERKLDEQASYASISFSPDGVSLACADLDFSEAKAGIYTLNLQTGEKSRLTKPDAPAVDHTPRFSPDGKSLAFIRYFSSFRREIFVVPANGGEPRQITSDDVRIYGLAWKADGGKLVFTSYRQNNQLNLWQISADGGEPQMISTGGSDLQSAAISPDGKTIAFVEETADENVWEIEPNNAPRPLIRSTRADHSPQFSPDGTTIAFASDRTGNYEIWVADADGKNQRQLSDSNSSAGSPRFSPDGKTITFDAQTSGSSDVYTVSVNGGAAARLTDGDENNSLPAWSADGQAIFFLSNRLGSDQIWRMSAKGGEAGQITQQGAFEMFAAPDGKTVIYSKNGKSGLWSVGTDGTDEKPIPELAEAGAWRSWTVASNGVYYIPFAAQPPFHIKFFDFATRQTKQINDVEKPPLTYYSNLSVAPDGKKILYAQQDQSASAIMLAELN